MRIRFNTAAQAIAFVGGLLQSVPAGSRVWYPNLEAWQKTYPKGWIYREGNNLRVAVINASEVVDYYLVTQTDLQVLVDKATAPLLGQATQQEVRMSIGRTATVGRDQIIVGCKNFVGDDFPKLRAAAARLKKGLKFTAFTTRSGSVIAPGSTKGHLFVDRDASVPYTDVTLVLDAQAKLGTGPAPTPFRLF